MTFSVSEYKREFKIKFNPNQLNLACACEFFMQVNPSLCPKAVKTKIKIRYFPVPIFKPIFYFSITPNGIPI